MKKFVLGSVAFAAIAAAAGVAPASAADMAARPYTKAPPAPMMAPIYSWTGFYIGGHVGGAWLGDTNIGGNEARFLGGIQGGADYQFGNNIVVGVEGQYSWLTTNDNATAFPGAGVVTRNTNGLGSVTGRVGWTWGPGLLYAKGGYAFTDTGLGVSVAGVPQPFATTGNSKSGYTVGAGLEYMFAPNWSAKAEYQYYNFGDTTFVAAPAGLAGATFHNDEHTVKLGVNYRFGWGGGAQRY